MIEILPVVHFNKNDYSGSLAINNSKRAFDSGADGIFLSDPHNSGDTRLLFEVYKNLSNEFPERYIGLNIYGLGPVDAVRALAKMLERRGVDHYLLQPPAALLIDDISNYGGGSKLDAIELKNSNPRLRGIKLLGGIALEGTYDDVYYETSWLEEAVDDAITDISSPAGIDKCKAMKRVLGEKSLMITGDVSAEDLRLLDGVVSGVIAPKGVETYEYSGIIDGSYLKKLKEVALSLAV